LLLKSSEKYLLDNSPIILTGAAVVGTLSTAYLAVRAGFRSSVLIQEEYYRINKQNLEPLNFDRKAKAKLIWPQFIPVVGSAGVTVACIVCANRISTKRVAAMAAAYALSEKRLDDYKDKIAEKFGIEQEKKIQQEVHEAPVRSTRVTEAIILGGEDVLCFDAYSGRYFKSSMESIRGAANDTNFDVIHDNYATLTNFWDRIGLEATAYSEDFGWTANCPLEIQFSTTMSSDDKPCMVVAYDVQPISRWNS
jgi:hypothetical protein